MYMCVRVCLCEFKFNFTHIFFFAKSLQLYTTLCNPIDAAAHQAPQSLGFSRQEH